MPTYIKQEGATVVSTEYTNLTSILKAKIISTKKASIVLVNQHASKLINWRILVSNDPEGAAGTWAEETTSAELAADTPVRYVLTGAFVWVDVQIQSEDSASPQALVWLLAVG